MTLPPRTTQPTARRDWLTLQEAADRTGLGTRTIRRYVATGQVTGYRVGVKAVRVKTADVDALFRPIPTAAS